MAVRLGLLFLLLVSVNWVHADVRSIEASDLAVSEGKVKNENLCILCEQFAGQALDYLNDNKTQEEAIESLHHACSELHHLREQCILLVDYYAPLFFLEIGLVQPEQFCTKVNLCGAKLPVHLPKAEDACSVCEHAIVDVLTKLKDPETQLEIIEVLIKACNKVEQYKQQCKKLVFEYGPLILVNAEKFLETTDVCVTIRACKPSPTETAVE
ncbi:unnamed protein product [Spirodela intermedia]|uniref:Pulmonary surfactant-associated protein B n=1 Tax=Spirodela intermedia TaxID=51605 RepID=A0A7I8JZ28_SPIIN|nr:unnamed protein product [Spirodela intermedia]